MTDDLELLLKQTLDAKPSRQKPKKESSGRADKSEGEQAGSPPAPIRSDERRKYSISLYADERRIVDRIIDSVREVRGERISMSEAIRIAVQLCPDDHKRIDSSFDRVRIDDRRRSTNSL